MAVESGVPVRRGAGELAAEGPGWGDERRLPAALLYELLARPQSGTQPRAAVLVGLRVTGRLNLEAAELQAPLIAHGCYFDAPVNLIDAKAPEVRLTACDLPGFAADGLETRGGLDLSKTSSGVASLIGARIGGQLNLSGATFKGGDHPLDLGEGRLQPPEAPAYRAQQVALMAYELQVDQSMFCDEGFSADGEVHLGGIHIGGELSFAGATLERGLAAPGLRVDRDMFCGEGFSAGGELSLVGAHIGGQLSFDGATLGEDLTADGLRVDQDMFCREGFSAGGELSLVGAHIGGQLAFSGATLGKGLNAAGLRVDQEMFCGEGFSAEGEVNLTSAHIGNLLSFDGATLGQGLTGDGLHVDQYMLCRQGFSARGEVNLGGAHVGSQLAFSGATLGEGLNAYGLRVDRDMYCEEGFSTEGEVNLGGAHVGSQLAFSGATLGKGLNAYGLRVDRDMYCVEGFSAEGAVNLGGAHIGSLLSFTGAKLAGGELDLSGAHIGQLFIDGARLTQSLNGEGLHVDRDMGCRGFNTRGEVRLFRAHIAGALSFDGATLGGGLAASGLRVDQDMRCADGFRAEGEINLSGAYIGGQLSFDGATLSSTGVALRLEAAQVDDDVILRFIESPEELDLTSARVARLFDGERIWPSFLQLRGFVYGGVRADEDAEEQSRTGWGRRGAPPDLQRRLRWIQLAEEGKREDKPRLARLMRSVTPVTSTGAGFTPQPYTQLMAVYRQEGRDSDARRVAFQRERRRASELGFSGRAWNAFLRCTVGYGYKPMRALALLAFLILVGTLAFSSFHDEGDLRALDNEHPPFVAAIYTIDRLIPVVSFGLRDAFGASGAAQWWAFAYTVLGWALTIAVVAGLNAAVRRD